MNANAAYQVPVQQRRRKISRQEMLRRKRAIRRRKRIVCFLRVSFAIVLLLTAVSFWQDYGHEILPAVNHLYYQLTARYDLPVVQYDFAALREENESDAAGSLSTTADTVSITEALAELAQNNAEAADFVADYPNRQNYLGQSIDLASDVLIGQVPLLLQWDKRWGYTIYGNDVAGLTACGPTALSMAAYYLTGGDPKMTPDKIIQFALDNGYCAPGNGSYWSLIYQGGEDLGLDVWEIDKGYASVKEELEGGHVIICLVGPGAFTTDGHFIVIAGMDSDGKLIINDSNSRTRSEKTWDYYEIYDQIDTMWTLCGHDYVG